MNTTDTSLVMKAIQGDEFALNRLLNQWYQPIFRYAFKYFGEREIALEVTQKSFIKVANKLSMLNEPEFFQAWLYKIVTNQCHEEIRRAKSKKLSQWFSLKGDSIISLSSTNILEHSVTETSEETDFSILENERSALLQKGLETLSEDLRSVLVLKHYQNLTFREIAEIIDVSENTVKTRLYSALKKLKTHFEKDQTIKAELWYE